jgi:hypothetical protein
MRVFGFAYAAFTVFIGAVNLYLFFAGSHNPVSLVVGVLDVITAVALTAFVASEDF